MTGNVALDVVIGLIFVYLLYSLLASVIAEMIASFLGLRARNLHKGVVRMLENDPEGKIGKVKGFSLLDKLIDVINDFIEWILRIVNTDFRAAKKFYDHPSIKYLARDKVFSKPSYIAPETFSKVTMDLIKKGQKGTDIQKINDGVGALTSYEKFIQDLKVQLASATPDYTAIKTEYASLSALDNPHFEEILKEIGPILDATTVDKAKLEAIIAKNPNGGFISGETLELIKSYLEDANQDVEKFKASMEHWFDITMNRIAGWYKRKNQLILLIIGFCLAASFKVSTIGVVDRLSKDNNAREQMVQLASAYVENNPTMVARVDSVKKDSIIPDDIKSFNAKLDSLLSIKGELDEDIEKANDILGFSLPDSILVVKIPKAHLDSVRRNLKPNQRIIEDSTYLITFDDRYTASDASAFYATKKCCGKVVTTKEGTFAYLDESDYFWAHWIGYLLTALAISLGAPFWFDLLNKLVKLRSSVQTSSTPKSPAPGAAPKNPEA